MATEVQWRRGTKSENNNFTGAVGEIVIDTTNWNLRIHDGSTAGGVNRSVMINDMKPTHYDSSGPHSGGDSTDSTTRRTVITPEYVELDIGGNPFFLESIESFDLNTSSNWDDSAYATASNRAGQDFYIYYCQPSSGIEPDIILSANSTVPSSMPSGDTPTEDNTRKVGGFHCLCEDVGTISGHNLDSYITGDVIPNSVWDIFYRPKSKPEGTSYDPKIDKWVDIYLPSWTGSEMVSAYNATIADGASSPLFHWYNFAELIGEKKRLLYQLEFQRSSLGSPQETNISGSSDPGTTGGHSDTNGRRIISDIGCEDMVGVLWQWGMETAATNDVGSSWSDADTSGDSGTYDSDNSINRGQHYEAPNRPRLGGAWSNGAQCGSRASNWDGSSLFLRSRDSSRGVAEPKTSRQ